MLLFDVDLPNHVWSNFHRAPTNENETDKKNTQKPNAALQQKKESKEKKKIRNLASSRTFTF